MIAARRRRRAPARVLLALLAALPLVGSCGKKGPPLAPLVRLPAAPSQVSASRAGETVTIRFTVPGANVSGVRPADIERVDVYAWTGPEMPEARVFKVASRVASVPVRTPPPPPDPDDHSGVVPPPPVGPGVDQGAAAVLQETLAAEAFEPIDVRDPKEAPPPTREPKVTPPDAVQVPSPLMRRYTVVGVNRGGKRGPPAAVVAVPLWTPPPPPVGLTATAHESGTELAWTAPAHPRGPVMADAIPPAASPAAAKGETGAAPRAPAAAPPAGTAQAAANDEEPAQTGGPPAATGERPRGTAARRAASQQEPLPARPAVPWPAVTIGYHVYEVQSPNAPAAASAQTGGSPPLLPARLTTAPVKAPTFVDTRVEHGVERCYVVRTVETMGTLSVESAASAPVCIRTRDVFPPPAPTSLAAVASEGAISLIWDGSDAPDLAGYIVLRGIAPGVPAERLTPEPIRETTFRDTRVTPGTRYVYAVVAVDSATPPNASPPSKQAEETAR